MAQTATFIPLDGRVTSLQILNLPLTGTEVMEIVSPGNVQFGNNFQVTINVLAAYFSSYPYLNTTVIETGATSITPYEILPTDSRILVDKTVGAATFIEAPLAVTMLSQFPVLIKDEKGDAATNNITITFDDAGGCDGQAEVVIDTNYGWVTINPRPGGGGWYES